MDKFLDDDENKEKVYQQIMKTKKASGIICDNLRSANHANYENFKKQLSNDFAFSKEGIFKILYNYGMFVSR